MSTSVSHQVFDWNRFTAALRKEVVENKRQLLLIVTSIFLFFLIFMVMGNVISNAMSDVAKNDSESEQVIELMPTIFIWTVYSFIVIIVASLAFRNLTSKTGRVALFTSPSSMTEKFTVNLLIYVVGAFVAFIVCAQLADLMRIAILSPFKSEKFAVPGITNFFTVLSSSSYDIMSMTDIFQSEGYESQIKIMTVLSIFLGPALFFMGSVLWPRWAFVKSFATQQVFNGIVNFIIMLFFAMPLLFGGSMESLSKADASSLAQGLSISNYIGYGIGLVCWFGAWYLFKRKDVVSLKWWS